MIHNIMKRFSESREISARMGKRWTLNACDLWPLMQQCNKNPHNRIKDNNMGAGTHWHWLTTVVSKHSLLVHLQMQVKTRPRTEKDRYQQHPETLLTSLGPEVIQDGLTQSPHFGLFLEIILSSGLKRKKGPFVTSVHFKSQHLWWYRGVFVPRRHHG